MKLLKRIALLMTFVIAISVPEIAVFADDGAEINRFYDFDGYSAAVGSDVMPDSNWDYYVIRYKNFGSAQSGDDHGTVLKVNGTEAEPNFYFGQLIKNGNLHISYDFKLLNNSTRMLMLFYQGQGLGSAPLPRRSATVADYYSKALWFNFNENKIELFQGAANGTSNMTGWDRITSEENYDFINEWHRVDMVTSGLSGNACYADFYIDGEKINAEPVYFGASDGFHTLGFRSEANSLATGANPALGVYLDNVYIRRYIGAAELEMNVIGSERVALENGTLRVRMSDFADIDKLSSQNVKIVDRNGEELSNYSIIPSADGGEFEVQFSGSIEPGRYNVVLSDEITGKMTGAGSNKPLEFKTDYMTVSVNTTVLEESFSGYSPENQGDLPDGFTTEAETTFALPVEGKDGTEDIALGFEVDTNSRVAQRYMTDFDYTIQEGGNYIIEFDTFVSDGDLRYYIATSNDSENAPENAILKIDSYGNVYKASSASANPSETLDGVTLTPGEWHHIRIEMRVSESGDTIDVKVIFDEDSENAKTFSNSYFAGCDITGFGLGFAPKQGMQAGIDNIKAFTDMNVLRPEVTDIRLYDYNGNKVEMSEKVTAMISYAEIEFNTLVTQNEEELKTLVTFTEDGVTKEYNCEIAETEDGSCSVMKCIFPMLLNEVCDYVLSVSVGVPSKIAESVKSIMADSFSFTTDRTLDLAITGADADGNIGNSLTFSKNDDSTGDFLYGGTLYSYKSCMIDGVETSVPVMEEVEVKRIVIPETFKGQFTEEITFEGGNGGFAAEYFLWHYPSLNKVELENDRVVK